MLNKGNCNTNFAGINTKNLCEQGTSEEQLQALMAVITSINGNNRQH